MINYDNPDQIEIAAFNLPFSGRLNPSNKWIQLSKMIPWEELAVRYTRKMCKDFGRMSIKPRVAIGALLIKHFKQMSDEDTVEEIQENPYLQYFLGYSGYQIKPCFDASLFVTIRKRLSARQIEAINGVFIMKVNELRQIEKESKRSNKRDNSSKDNDVRTDSKPPNKGKLIVDATVAPSNIKYPTDLDLLNQSREISEGIIDKLYMGGRLEEKPRTYRRKARQSFLGIIKKKRKSHKMLRQGIKRQLQYLRRNLAHIEDMIKRMRDNPDILSARDNQRLETIRMIFIQQEQMFREGTHSVEDRIVSIHQPQVRPIVRGKAGADVEFGAKISLSVVDGLVSLDRLKWDAYNENQDLIAQVNKYRRRYGFFPVVVVADGIYGTRENRQYLREYGIRFSGKKVGRPTKEIDAIFRNMERLRRIEQGERNEIEGKIGTAKTRYGLGKVMAKTEATSKNWIAMAIFSMNMATALRQLLLSLFYRLRKWGEFLLNLIKVQNNLVILPNVR